MHSCVSYKNMPANHVLNNLYPHLQYFSTHFPKRSLFPHTDADHDELPISIGDGTTSVMALFIKGVDNRATLTKNWSSFLHKANMKKGCVYAFAFKCTSKGLYMIVYPI
uniref:TF-B3 domain-containing protein n=1 Tax=Triticum urartu TaxID=4572 RepID=A0A8R7QLZ3_TRIUA